jgi:hypothetical protein
MRVDHKASDAQKKAHRAEAVAKIQVSITRADGTVLTFDGDEESQKRLDRFARRARRKGYAQIPWKMADNSVAQVTPDEMEEALDLAGEKQGELWFV